jgi:hypothetical protein
VELAHGGRGHSSSRDRYSSHSSGGRSGRGGVSRRSEFRGVYFIERTPTLICIGNIMSYEFVVSPCSACHWIASFCIMARP